MILKKHNESGFSLIEVMIASGILLVVAFAITSMLTQMNTEQNRTKDKADLYGIQQQLTYDLRYKPLK